LKTSERKKVAKYNQGNFEGNGKGEDVEKRKRGEEKPATTSA
jgi:hypothetical protein